ncbi:WD40 domain-containing protein [Colletotrichum simmondsii]|uniref:WD40 domain-containing protein n=1 Tax=Colletotrichum simmondsii TaxID=703756 RepID=A0A135RZV8_9PEZI|nr:WD40 domain-containing protein [Colletotrichum simmondsii]
MHFSRIFKSSPHCASSPDGNLIATLSPTSVGVRSVETLETIHSVKLPSNVGTAYALRWSPSSRRILACFSDQVLIYSASGPGYRGVIRNPATPNLKPTFVQFGASDTEIFMCSSYGLKFSIFDLATSRTIEISNPKFHQASVASRGFALRPGSGHLAILTRVAGKDIASVHHPKTRQVLRSWQPDTVDAQGLAWTPDGRWLLMWESAAQGHKILFYTPDGHLFKTWSGPSPWAIEEKHYELGAGVKHCQVSPDGARIAVCDHTRSVCVLETKSAAESMRLEHPATITPRDTVQIWQEEVATTQSGSQHSFSRATQSVSAPGRASNGTVDTKPARTLSVFDASSSLLATTLEDWPSTVWVWDLASSELRAVLIFHSQILAFSWHPKQREVLMVTCEGENYAGLVFVWDPLSDGPKTVHFRGQLPDAKVLGKPQASWLDWTGDSAVLLLGDSKHHLMASLAEAEESGAPWQDAQRNDLTMTTGKDETQMEAHALDDFDDDLSGLDMSELPFDTNWRQFKDWLREGCVVDHVQIFGPNRLKEGVFHGRRIMFDDRNMSNPIMIKDVEVNENSASTRTRSQRPGFTDPNYQQTGPYSYDSYPEVSQLQWDQDSYGSRRDYSTQQPAMCYVDDGFSTGTYSTSSGQTDTTFQTPDTARSAAEALGVKDWMSYKSDPCCISEGTTGGQPQKPVSRPKKSGDPAKKKRSTEKSKTSATPTSSSSRPSGDPSSSHQPQIQKESKVVIVDGSTSRSRSESKQKRK